MIDSHCHLNCDVFEDDLHRVIKNAREAGVESFIIPGTSIPSSKRAIEIVENFENTYAAVGIHPTELEGKVVSRIITQIEDLVRSNEKVVAIGEVGLDYYHLAKNINVSGRAEQQEFFNAQLRLSVKLNLPVIIHNRLATEDIISNLKSIGSSNFTGKCVFHCCPPDESLLRFAIKNSIYIGVDGDVTYDRDKQDFIKRVPLELLMLETDSPYLTPEPVRSVKRFPNNPANLVHTAEIVSKLIGTDVKSDTTRNAKQLFGL